MQNQFPIVTTMLRICLSVVWLTLVTAGVGSAQAVGGAETDDRGQLKKDVDALLDSTFPNDKPGAAVIVFHGGKVIYKSARGMAELELQVPLSSDMVFRIGSMTKQFTAAAIMLLVEEGKVSVTDEITKFLPDYPTQGTTITVEHLLTNSSGIRSYTGIPGWMRTKIVNHMTVETLIDGFKNEPMDFKPGEKFRYNNSGYVLLGAIIEKASGQTYAEFIQQRIFDPLEMTHSYYGSHDSIIKNRASGYQGSAKRPKNAQYLSMTQPFAAGSLLSTVEDLGKWNTALFAGKIVTKKSLARMISNYKLDSGSLAGYGYGLRPGEIRGHKAVSHGGGIFGFVTHGVFLPDDDIYVAVLCNSSFYNPSKTATKIAAMAAGLPAEREVAEIDFKIYDDYVGEYELAPSFSITITRDRHRLLAQATGQPKFELFPSTETRFFLKVVEAELSFGQDKAGKVSYIVLKQGGIKQTGQRK